MEGAQDLYVFLKNKALVFLSIREHSELELSRKLLSSARDGSDKFLIQKIIQDLVQELVSKNYLSNTRYAEAYILSRARKGYGPNYIKQALRQAGLSQDLIHEVLEKLESSDINWTEIGLEVLKAKFKNTDLSDYKNRQKCQ